MSKIILLLSSIIAVGTPLITTIACNKKNKIINRIAKKIQNEKNENIYAHKYYRPFQFKELKELGKGQPLMDMGIGYESYVHGMSFLFNVLRNIGFDMVVGKPKVTNGHASKIKYYNDHTQKSILKKYPQEDPEAILKLFDAAKSKAIREANRVWEGGGVYSIATTMLDPIGVDNSFSNGWAANAGYIWQNYFCTNTFTKKDLKFVYDGPNVDTDISDEENLFGALGTAFSQKFLEYGIASFWLMIDGNKPQSQNPTFKSGARTILGLAVNNYDPLHGDWKTKLFQKKIQTNKKWSFSYYLVSKKNWLQNYIVLKNQVKIDEMKMLITSIIKNLNYLSNKGFEHPILKYVHPDIKRAFEFIRALDFKDNQTLLADINKAVEALNNGTHNMFAVEIFARGIEHMPTRYLPMGYGIKKTLDKKRTRHLVGMANSVVPHNLLNWVHTTKKGYEDEKGEVSLQDREGFDFETMNPFTSTTKNKEGKWTHLTRRVGSELKPMGGIVEKIIYKKWWQTYQEWQTKNKDHPLVPPLLKYALQKYLI